MCCAIFHIIIPYGANLVLTVIGPIVRGPIPKLKPFLWIVDILVRFRVPMSNQLIALILVVLTNSHKRTTFKLQDMKEN